MRVEKEMLYEFMIQLIKKSEREIKKSERRNINIGKDKKYKNNKRKNKENYNDEGKL